MSGRDLRRKPGDLDSAAFVAIYGGVYEHSPWIAEAVAYSRSNRDMDTAEGLHAAMKAVVERAPRERQLALLCAHPDLAGRLAMRGELTAQSTAEQAGAGLDACSPEEFARFQSLNERYKRKFAFPFIMAVRGRHRGEILAAFEQRANNDEATEFATALAEVHKIALLRLREM
jgi:OHCU decarboxylase